MPLTPTPKNATHRMRQRIRGKNVGREIAAGKAPSQAAAIAYSEERRTGGPDAQEAEYDIKDTKCKIDDHRPCELASAVAFARGISQDYNTPIPPKLQAILDTGKVTENQVRAALSEWKYTLPKNGQREAEYLIAAAFPTRGK